MFGLDIHVMKFGQKFGVNKISTPTKFRGNSWSDFGFEAQKPPRRGGHGTSQKFCDTGHSFKKSTAVSVPALVTVVFLILFVVKNPNASKISE